MTPAIMTPTRLKSTLTTIRAHLPEEWLPAVPMTDAPAHIYHFLDLAALAVEDGWEVHIKIPLQCPPCSQYQMVPVTTIPTQLQSPLCPCKEKSPVNTLLSQIMNFSIYRRNLADRTCALLMNISNQTHLILLSLRWRLSAMKMI